MSIKKAAQHNVWPYRFEPSSPAGSILGVPEDLFLSMLLRLIDSRTAWYKVDSAKKLNNGDWTHLVLLDSATKKYVLKILSCAAWLTGIISTV